jgi:branched-chain amino acid transport system substrate-binding protein
LVRDIQELVNLKIIDENLKIISPATTIIFNGTAVARSPYILQTLFAILILIKKNPDNVFYLEGDFEQKELWKAVGFVRQLDVLYRKDMKKTSDLFEELIKVSPLAFYGNYEKQPEKLLKITALTDTLYDRHENSTDDFFYTLKPHHIETWDFSRKEKTPKPVFTGILFDGTSPDLKTSVVEPLMFVEPIAAASVWRVFSGATPVFYKLYGFKTDTFAIITLGQKLEASTIALFTQDRFLKNGFMHDQVFDIDTSSVHTASEKAHDDSFETFYIGTSLDLSRSNYNMGDRVRTGITLAIKALNQSGDLKEKEVQAIILDDEYAPRLAHRNIERLKNEFDVHTLLLPIGSPTLVAAQDLLYTGKILLAFPVSGASQLRQPDCKGAVNFRPSYDDEVDALLNYMLKEYNYRTFAFFYQDDEYGNACMKRAKEILAANGIQSCIELPYTRNTTNFEKQKELLKGQQIEALGCFSSSQTTQEFFRQLGAAYFIATKVFAVSFAVDDVFEAFVNYELGVKCLFSRVVPNPTLSQLEIVKEYRAAMDSHKKPYDVYSLEGYICTSILGQMIKRVNGRITHEALLTQLESLKGYNFKGLPLTFDPATRQISRRIWFDFQEDQEWKEILLEKKGTDNSVPLIKN